MYPQFARAGVIYANPKRKNPNEIVYRIANSNKSALHQTNNAIGIVSQNRQHHGRYIVLIKRILDRKPKFLKLTSTDRTNLRKAYVKLKSGVGVRHDKLQKMLVIANRYYKLDQQVKKDNAMFMRDIKMILNRPNTTNNDLELYRKKVNRAAGVNNENYGVNNNNYWNRSFLQQ